MSGHLFYNNRKVEAIGELVTIPDNDIARLMYYLNCVFTVLKYNGFSRYTDYKNYEEISDSYEDFSKVLELATIFNPKILMEAGIFVIDENIGLNNRFFEITDERMNFHASKEIIIGGIRTRILKIMVMKSIWLINNYYMPIKRISELEIKSCSESDFDNDNESVKSGTCLIF